MENTQHVGQLGSWNHWKNVSLKNTTFLVEKNSTLKQTKTDLGCCVSGYFMSIIFKQVQELVFTCTLTCQISWKDTSEFDTFQWQLL